MVVNDIEIWWLETVKEPEFPGLKSSKNSFELTIKSLKSIKVCLYKFFTCENAAN